MKTKYWLWSFRQNQSQKSRSQTSCFKMKPRKNEKKWTSSCWQPIFFLCRNLSFRFKRLQTKFILRVGLKLIQIWKTLLSLYFLKIVQQSLLTGMKGQGSNPRTETIFHAKMINWFQATVRAYWLDKLWWKYLGTVLPKSYFESQKLQIVEKDNWRDCGVRRHHGGYPIDKQLD